jgi:hypothetical protein
MIWGANSFSVGSLIEQPAAKIANVSTARPAPSLITVPDSSLGQGEARLRECPLSLERRNAKARKPRAQPVTQSVTRGQRTDTRRPPATLYSVLQWPLRVRWVTAGRPIVTAGPLLGRRLLFSTVAQPRLNYSVGLD